MAKYSKKSQDFVEKAMHKMKKGKLLTIFVVLVYIFLFAPLVVITMTSIGTENYIAFPPKGFTLKWFINIFYKIIIIKINIICCC